jgi:hypothetical protein
MGGPLLARALAALAVLALLVAAGVVLARRALRGRVAARRGVPPPARRAALTALHHLLADAAEASGARLFLHYGTLLGYARSGDLICYDYDLDYGVAEDEFPAAEAAVRAAAAAADAAAGGAGAFGVRCERRPWNLKLEVVHRPTGITADVFPLRAGPRGVKRARVPAPALTWLMGERVAFLPGAAVFPLVETGFLGRRAFVPADPHRVLALLYGPGYLTPDHVCDAGCNSCVRRAAP